MLCRICVSKSFEPRAATPSWGKKEKLFGQLYAAIFADSVRLSDQMEYFIKLIRLSDERCSRRQSS
jgi:hypothetical protein